MKDLLGSLQSVKSVNRTDGCKKKGGVVSIITIGYGFRMLFCKPENIKMLSPKLLNLPTFLESFCSLLTTGKKYPIVSKGQLKMSLTKLDVLRYLSGNEGATVKDLASEFSYEEGSIRAYMNTLNSRGLVKKVREDRKLTYFLTNSGKQRLDFLEEKLESEDEENFGENLEVRSNIGGKKKMSRVAVLDDGLYECPQCGQRWDLEGGVLEDSDEAFCDQCDCALEPVDDDETGEEEEIVESVRRRR